MSVISYKEGSIKFLFSFVASSRIITSPNYPGQYPRNLDCKWVIVGAAGKTITVSFMTFHLENSIIICFDELRAYEGRGVNGRQIFR